MPFRFLVVGGWNFVFGYLAFAGCYWLWQGKIPDWTIVLISSILGITNSFIFHRWLTYHSHGNVIAEYLRFYIVYGAQIVIQMALISVFVTWLEFNAYVVAFLTNVLLTIASYWGHKCFSFRPQEASHGQLD